MSWHVITAGPSAGKTSVIRELNARGYTTAPEGARLVIDQAVSEGKDVEELRADPVFHEMVEDADRRIMSNLPEDEVVFMDRSIIDNIAYRRLADRAVPMDEYPDLHHFDSVFLLERIEFEDDYARIENEEWAQEIHEELRDVYNEFGFTVYDVPLIPVDERADMIERYATQGPPAIH